MSNVFNAHFITLKNKKCIINRKIDPKKYFNSNFRFIIKR